MIVATVIDIRGFGCDESRLGRCINIYRQDAVYGEDNRTLTYTRLELSTREEATMLAWSLMPQKSNRRWWERYEEIKASEWTSKAVQPTQNGHSSNQEVWMLD